MAKMNPEPTLAKEYNDRPTLAASYVYAEIDQLMHKYKTGQLLPWSFILAVKSRVDRTIEQ